MENIEEILKDCTERPIDYLASRGMSLEAYETDEERVAGMCNDLVIRTVEACGMSTPRPCPICGKRPAIVHNTCGDVWSVQCRCCTNGGVLIQTRWLKGKRDAIWAWNSRP